MLLIFTRGISHNKFFTSLISKIIFSTGLTHKRILSTSLPLQNKISLYDILLLLHRCYITIHLLHFNLKIKDYSSLYHCNSNVYYLSQMNRSIVSSTNH